MSGALDPAGLDGRIREALAPFVAEGRLVGAAVAVLGPDAVLAEAAAGSRDVGGRQAMTRDTVFRIASLTKALTTVAALQLVEGGRLRLDDPADAVLPLLAQARVLTGFDAGGQPILRPPRGRITLRHLLTHTAGFVYGTWDAALARYEALTGLPIVVTGRRAALASPLRFDPGERWEYGINLDIVGAMIEAVSGDRLERHLSRHLFEPLGMTDTTYAPRPSWGGRLAPVHRRAADGGLEPVAVPPVPACRDFDPGGNGLFSTLSDYGRFLRMLLAEGRLGGVRLLEAASVRAMFTNQIGDLAVGPLATRDPALSASLDLLPEAAPKWGFGLLLNTRPGPDGRRAGSGAWGGLYNTHYWLDPGAGVAGLFLTQVMPFADPEAMAGFAAFERAVYG